MYNFQNTIELLEKNREKFTLAEKISLHMSYLNGRLEQEKDEIEIAIIESQIKSYEQILER